MTFLRIVIPLCASFFEHVLFAKPVPTFAGHALAALKSDGAAPAVRRGHRGNGGLLAELTAMRASGFAGCSNSPFGIGNFAALLVSGHTACAPHRPRAAA